MQSAQSTVCSVLSIMQVALVILTQSAQKHLKVKEHIYIYRERASERERERERETQRECVSRGFISLTSVRRLFVFFVCERISLGKHTTSNESEENVKTEGDLGISE